MVEELIATILKDIKQKGYSSIKPFSIGKIELRMMLNSLKTATK